MLNIPDINLWATWIGIAAGVVSGAGIGLFFADDRFAGGYCAGPAPSHYKDF